MQPLSTVHGSHVSSIVKILLIWALGGILALIHHIFYSQLNNRAVHTLHKDHITPQRPASSGIAFIQCAWKLVRQRAFTVAGLDALWAAPYSPLSFLEWDFWRTARGVVLVGALVHAFPLVITFIPGTLTVRGVQKTEVGECTVPTFDFGKQGVLFEQLNSAARIYSQPSSLALRVVGATILGGQPFPPTSPCAGNCTYTISVNAPSFTCIDSLQNATALPSVGDASKLLAPPAYIGVAFDATPSPASRYTGWDFQAHYLDYSDLQPTDKSHAGRDVSCVAYNSTYELDYAFMGSTPSVVVRNIVRHEPAGQLLLTEDGLAGTFVPGSTGIHTELFNTTTNYYALLASLYTYLDGNVTTRLTGNSLNFILQPPNIAATQSRLVSSIGGGSIVWAAQMPAVMESLLQNITLSILALSPDEATQLMRTVPCTTYTTAQLFSYTPSRLWLIYGLALILSFLCNLLGIAALRHNAFGATGGFSDFLAATRNSDLAEGDGMGRASTTSRDWQRMRLKYGLLRSSSGDGSGRYAFAPPESLLEHERKRKLAPGLEESVENTKTIPLLSLR
ncbi:hypothetical protein MKEN_00493400 [Mycena kentingensis (nom. inval.)]|nr:hypothetical protein MKEN_00493400 [Mycena kentingensis (nom. inval.)]